MLAHDFARPHASGFSAAIAVGHAGADHTRGDHQQAVRHFIQIQHHLAGGVLLRHHRFGETVTFLVAQ
ncbi:hypothetical protein D3C71_2034720 [compost metagenome]